MAPVPDLGDVRQPELPGQRPEAAEKIARAEQMALKFIADNSAEDIVAALPDSYVSGDRATYARAVENARDLHPGRSLHACRSGNTAEGAA